MWREETLRIPVRDGAPEEAAARGGDADAVLVAQASIREGGEGLAALVLHPHPALGGSANNNVVHAMRGALTAAPTPCCCVCCVNMRGVGGSTGRVALRGTRDSSDAAQCIDHLLRREGVRGVIVVGYSWYVLR